MSTPHCCEMIDASDSPVPNAARWGARIGKWALPSIILAIMPKCPACLAAYLALGTGIGLSFPVASALRTSLILICVAALTWLTASFLLRMRRRRTVHPM